MKLRQPNHSNSNPIRWQTIAFALFFGALFGCVGRIDVRKTNSIENLSYQTINTPSLTNTLDISNEQATIWREDAILVRISLDFAPLASDEELISSVTYVSGEGGNYWYLIRINENQAENNRVLFADGDEYEDPRENAEVVNVEGLNLTISDALQISQTQAQSILPQRVLSAMKWSGWIDIQHSDSYEHTGPIEWIVTFDQGINQGAFHVFIDDSTGQVLEVRNFIN